VGGALALASASGRVPVLDGVDGPAVGEAEGVAVERKLAELKSSPAAEGSAGDCCRSEKRPEKKDMAKGLGWR
jgi:hypothetical protein